MATRPTLPNKMAKGDIAYDISFRRIKNHLQMLPLSYLAGIFAMAIALNAELPAFSANSLAMIPLSLAVA